MLSGLISFLQIKPTLKAASYLALLLIIDTL
jgi:hypothetical protein